MLEQHFKLRPGKALTVLEVARYTIHDIKNQKDPLSFDRYLASF